ncbi:hypothetical protein ACT4UT_14575, partial [Bacillus sp. B-TM1]
ENKVTFIYVVIVGVNNSILPFPDSKEFSAIVEHPDSMIPVNRRTSNFFFITSPPILCDF